MRVNYGNFGLRKKLLGVVAVLLIFAAAAVSAVASTYYVDASRPDNNGDGRSWSTAKKTISAGISLLGNGDDLIIADGTYKNDDLNGIPSGSAGDYTVVRAQNSWGVTVELSDRIDIENSYINLRGLKLYKNNSSKIFATGDYIKIQECASDGEEGSGYSFGMFGDYFLVEDCFQYGSGRYPFRTGGGASYGIWRRCVSRWDYSNTAEPQASFGNYDADGPIYYQNCIAVDAKDIIGESGRTYDGYKAFFTPNGGRNNRYEGCIALNNEGAGFWMEDSPVEGAEIINSVSWDCKDAIYPDESEGYPAYLLYSRADTTGEITINHSVFGKGSGRGVNIKQPIDDSVRNSIFYNTNATALDMSGDQDYNCFYGNTENSNNSIGNNSFASENGNEIDPGSNSLKYLVRIEDGSDLSGKADDGGKIGATILYKIGETGTIYGESGWNATTSEPLWPFPNEDVMRADMKAFYKAPGEAFSGSPEMSGDRGVLCRRNDPDEIYMGILGKCHAF